MFSISRDTPVHYLTSVSNNRLPVFRTDRVKEVTCAAIDEARKSAGFLLFAYVIMPDHIHTITGSERKPSEVLRFINGIVSKRVIDYLKEGGFQSSLDKLRHAKKERCYSYSLWQHENNAKPLFSEGVFMQRVNYIHQNPVRAGLVERAEEYRWSSVRCWNRSSLEDEPLLVDIDQIRWGRTRGVASR
jgi:REP element-mobilizing transposase RayT